MRNYLEEIINAEKILALLKELPKGQYICGANALADSLKVLIYDNRLKLEAQNADQAQD